MPAFPFVEPPAGEIDDVDPFASLLRMDQTSANEDKCAHDDEDQHNSAGAGDNGDGDGGGDGDGDGDGDGCDGDGDCDDDDDDDEIYLPAKSMNQSKSNSKRLRNELTMRRTRMMTTATATTTTTTPILMLLMTVKTILQATARLPSQSASAALTVLGSCVGHMPARRHSKKPFSRRESSVAARRTQRSSSAPVRARWTGVD